MACGTVWDSFEQVFDTPKDASCSKLQSWSAKVANATNGSQIKVDMHHVCHCKKSCCCKFISSYENSNVAEEALATLRFERTQATARDESIWLFNHLFESRVRSPSGSIHVLFRLDGVTVCEEYFVTALGLTFPNRRVQRYVRLIQVMPSVCMYVCAQS